jgi:hypothetical protein
MELLSDEGLRGLKAPIAIVAMLVMAWAVILLARPQSAQYFNVDPSEQPTAVVESPKPSPFAVPKPKTAPVRHFSTAPARRPVASETLPALPSPQFLPVEWTVPVSTDDSDYNR